MPVRKLDLTRSHASEMLLILYWLGSLLFRCLCNNVESRAHPAKIDLNKKWLPKQKTIQNFNIDALGFRKTRNENPPTQEIGLTS